MSSGRALQRECYDEIRLVYKLPAQMACNVPRQVGATYKTLWTKARQNEAARRAGTTKKRYKGLDQAPKYVSPTLTYNYHRDYSLKEDAQVSILTLDGRVIVPYTGYTKHVALIGHGAHIGAAKLWYDKPKSQFYLLVSLTIEVTDPRPQMYGQVVGVDGGQRYLAVTTTTKDETAFYAGSAIRAKADHYARLRKRLQKKGTRSATRRLIVISGRERRLKQDCNHQISRRIIDQPIGDVQRESRFAASQSEVGACSPDEPLPDGLYGCIGFKRGSEDGFGPCEVLLKDKHRGKKSRDGTNPVP
jgi:putative transposase